MKKNISQLSLEYLKVLKDFLEESTSLEEAISRVDGIIIEEEDNKKKSYNERFTVEMMKMPKNYEELLFNNGIETLADLRSCNISSLNGIDQVSDEYFTWAKEFYNLDSGDEKMLLNK